MCDLFKRVSESHAAAPAPRAASPLDFATGSNGGLNDVIVRTSAERFCRVTRAVGDVLGGSTVRLFDDHARYAATFGEKILGSRVSRRTR